MMLDLLSRVRNNNNDILIRNSRKEELRRETRTENFESEKRKSIIKLLIRNTELKLACKEQKEKIRYLHEKFFQERALIISDDELIFQEIFKFSQKLGRVKKLKEEIGKEKVEIAKHWLWNRCCVLSQLIRKL